MVAVQSGRPVYLGDVATVTDGPEEPADYVYFGTGGAGTARRDLSGGHVDGGEAQRGQRNQRFTRCADENGLPARLCDPEGPAGDCHTKLRTNGKHKSDELLKHLFLATISVTILVGLALGWRESGVVLLAIPVTLALTLFIFYAYGYTLNRVTLFALIFSIGILVDDAIVVVENIVRHFRLPEIRADRGVMLRSKRSTRSAIRRSWRPLQ